DLVAERPLEMLEQPAYPLLGRAHREVAVGLAGARDRVRPDLVRPEREADLLERGECSVDVGDAGDDQVLLPCQADVAAERLDEIRDRDQLVARRKSER